MPGVAYFTYTANLREDLQRILNHNHILTKRELFRVVMSLFDPLGLVSIFLVQENVYSSKQFGPLEQVRMNQSTKITFDNGALDGANG